MEPVSLTTVGAILIGILTSLGLCIGCIAALMVVMRNIYGKIIESLTTQNGSQQRQIDRLRKEYRVTRVREARKEAQCREDITQLKEEITLMRGLCPLLSGEDSCSKDGCPHKGIPARIPTETKEQP